MRLTSEQRQLLRRLVDEAVRARMEHDRREHTHLKRLSSITKSPVQSKGTGVTQGTLNSTRGRANPNYGMTRQRRHQSE